MNSAEPRDHDHRDDPRAADERTAAGASSTGQGGGSGGYEPGGGGYGGNDGRPRPDPILSQRFELLDIALHGPFQISGRRALNWSGVNETTVAFDSLEQALAGAVPVDRPTSDLPEKSGNERSGG
jgi:hypothetical protein